MRETSTKLEKTIKFVFILIGIIQAGLYFFEYFYQHYDYTVLIRAVFWVIAAIIVLIFGIKTIPELFVILAFVLTVFIDYRHYYCFFVITLFSFYRPKLRNVAILIYVIEIVFVDFFHENRDVINLIIHLINCGVIYLFTWLLRSEYYKVKNLDLTEDDIKILNELAAGKKQKEIDFFNKNTVTDKLEKARLRNNCNTTEELLIRFIIKEKIGRNPII